ncbi:MAG: hypothetical protein M0Z91_07505 [Actinomycetota bacterium]|nr:hypothetical protein [Actinomycetota bacterium]
MMSKREVIWRHLLVGAREGRRGWPSVTALAEELGIAISTTHRSLAHPLEIGALDLSPLGGLRVLDPVRLLALFAAHRHVQRDLVSKSWAAMAATEIEAAAVLAGATLGGFGAVVAHLGVNRIADYSRVLIYGRLDLSFLPKAPEGDGTEVWVAEPDPWLRLYGPVTPLVQAWADLFSMPGWQAARFVEALDPREVTGIDQPVLLV